MKWSRVFLIGGAAVAAAGVAFLVMSGGGGGSCSASSSDALTVGKMISKVDAAEGCHFVELQAANSCPVCAENVPLRDALFGEVEHMSLAMDDVFDHIVHGEKLSPEGECKKDFMASLDFKGDDKAGPWTNTLKICKMPCGSVWSTEAAGDLRGREAEFKEFLDKFPSEETISEWKQHNFEDFEHCK